MVPLLVLGGASLILISTVFAGTLHWVPVFAAIGVAAAVLLSIRTETRTHLKWLARFTTRNGD